MKSNTFFTSNKIFHEWAGVVLFFLIFSISCTKHDNENDFKGAVLTFRIEGVQDANSILNSKASIRNANMVGLKVEDHLYKKTFYKDEYSFDILSEQSNINTDFTLDVPKKFNESTKLANPNPMGQGIHYRLIVLTLSDELVASVDVKVGQVQHISVTPGQSYKWRAFSFNSTNATPNVSLSDPIIETPTTESLLYAFGDNTGPIDNDGHIIPIVFSHQLTQLEVRVGLSQSDPFRTIEEVSGEFIGNVIKKCNFNIITGQKSGALVPVDVGLLDFTQLNEGSNKTLVAKKYYTADDSFESYSVKINSLIIQNTSVEQRDLTTSLPTPSGGVQGQVNFVGFTNENSGNVLVGRLELTVNQAIPPMKLVAFSDLTTYGYKLDPNTASGNFIRSSYNFGPTSNYIKITSLTVSSEGSLSNSYIGTNILNNPATYPDILVIANSTNYVNEASWQAVERYLNAGGNVFYTQDAADNLAMTHLSNIFGETMTNTFISEAAAVSLFTNTLEGKDDLAILQGPFGDVSTYNWGQDVAGTPYVNYLSENSQSDNIIAYSTHSQNYAPPGINRMSFFRHKSKSFFYVGDGGFLANIDPSGDYGGATYWNIAPFRTVGGTSADQYFPAISLYGRAAQPGSPTYFAPHVNATVGTYEIANSMMFGNIISWMLHRAHFYPVNRN